MTRALCTSAWLLTLGALIISCYPVSTLQEPQTLPAGGVRVVAQAKVGAGFTGSHSVSSYGPELGLRVGLIERLELQAGASFVGGRLGVKALLVDWPSLMLAVAPAYQFELVAEDEDRDSMFDEEPPIELPYYRVHSAVVPFIVGIPVADGLDILLGADVHAGWRSATWSSESGPLLAFGGHLGAARHTGPGRATFVPQCGVLVGTLSAPGSVRSEGETIPLDDLRRGDVRWECALGVSFGSRYAPRRQR